MSEPRIVLNALATHLGRYAYRYGDEIQLHERIAQVLTLHGFEFERERVLDARNRADFWLDGLVIEVKVGGGLSEALHQVGRYIKLPDVTGVILAGTPRWAGEALQSPPVWLDKPFQMLRLARQSL
ncbi:hypothetical protein C1893_23030 [Pseudomonas sp. MPR-ANC1]|uniref:hypothetical protein n=1 Tax=Pseudomonas sp. MPR-ANC1 TaxID=2075548 RepID=UPI000CD09A89|nr:hypothetical protein [Pseudomonas sp. MPR-ANC1]POA45532.1 hypothetical protein C1893_23030 [Pseudomonas sp. MPR-ANC1]